MATSPHALVTLQNDDTDPDRVSRQLALLRKNLTSAGIQVSKYVEQAATSSPDQETKCDLASLYTLGVTFLTSGAAVALINALRATYLASRNGKIHVKVVLPTKTIDISGDQLSDARSGQLLTMLQQELQP